MKKITTLVLSFALIQGVYAQKPGAVKSGAVKGGATKAVAKTATSLDRTQKPKAGPAPVIKLAEPASFELPNGLKVFVVENHKLPVVSVSLELDIKPILEKEKAGYVQMAGEMMGRNSKKRDKDQFDSEIDMLGATFSTSSNGFYAQSLKRNLPNLLEIVSDAIVNAEFKAEEMEKIRKQTLDGLANEKEEASSISEKLKAAANFGKNHPYGETMTEETVKKITLDDVKGFYNSYFRPNIGYMAVVGDITPAEAKALITQHFGGWQKAEVPSKTYPNPAKPTSNRVFFANKEGAVQSVIALTHPIDLKPGAPDAIKASVMNTLLGDGDARLFKNLRESKAYTYGAYSRVSTDPILGNFNAFADVRNAVTDSAVDQFFYELKRIRDEKVEQKELDGIKNYMTGNFAIRLESPRTIARYAINIARYNLPKDYYQNYLKNLAAVTVDDIQNVAKTYIQPDNMNIVVVGNKEEVAKKLARFASNGKVEFFDYKADAVEENTTPLPAGVTAETVIDKYIAALGGAANIAKVKDMVSKYSATVQGMAIEAEMKKKSPDKYSMAVTMNGAMVLNKQVYDGKKGQVSGMQGTEEATGEDLEDMKANTSIVPEMDYKTKNFKLELKSIEMVNNNPAFKLEVTAPWGKKWIEFYDQASGLKVKEVRTQETPQGSMSQATEYSDYRDVKGVKFPYQINQNFGPQVIIMKASDIQINAKLKDADFEIK